MSVRFKAYESMNTIPKIKKNIKIKYLFQIIIIVVHVIKLQRWIVIMKIPRRQQKLNKLFKFNTQVF